MKQTPIDKKEKELMAYGWKWFSSHGNRRILVSKTGKFITIFKNGDVKNGRMLLKGSDF